MSVGEGLVVSCVPFVDQSDNVLSHFCYGVESES